MIRVAGEHGVSTEDCIQGTGLTRHDLTDPTREIGGEQELGVLRNILRAVPRSVPIAFIAGQCYGLASQGMLGFAIMSCSDGWSACDLTTRFFDLSLSFNRLAFHSQGGRGRLIYDDSDNPEDLRAALVERDLGALAAFQRDVLNRVLPARAILLRTPRPAYGDPFHPVFAVRPQFGADINCVDFDLRLLDTHWPMSDERGRRVAEEQCRLLIEHRELRSGLTARVRSRVARADAEFPSMPTVAAELGMSTRTLRNRLAREGTSFREVVEQTREVVALQLLAAGLTNDTVAGRLGYSDTSSFVSAFKRWKGVPPGHYRQEPHARNGAHAPRVRSGLQTR